MASAAFTAAARRTATLLAPAAVTCCTVATYSVTSGRSCSDTSTTNVVGHGYARCSSGGSGPSTTQTPPIRNGTAATTTTTLRKRMTSIGRFSMKSETPSNLSIPTFFIALSGKANPSPSSSSSDAPPISHAAAAATATGGMENAGRSGGGMTASEFERIWLHRDMPSRHPRFHSRVSADDDRYFQYETDSSSSSLSSPSSSTNTSKDTDEDPIRAELHRHVRETVHPGPPYRSDLRKRIERFLTEPIDLTTKLWEVTVSSGPLGSSGAVSRLKADNLRGERRGVGSRREESAGGVGGGGTNKEEEIESLLLFRAHHSLADGVSLISALGDLVDEADEIRSMIRDELARRKKRLRQLSLWRRWLKLLQRLIWFTIGSIYATLYQTYLLWTTPRNPFEEVLGLEPNSFMEGKTPPGRSISWCDAAPLDEVKAIARDVGPKVTVNDVFVSCVAAAVARQLEEHRERLAAGGAMSSSSSSTGKAAGGGGAAAARCETQSSINVVVPVHLMGGAILPGRSVGNNIGAFVARVPADVHGGDAPAVSDSSPTTKTEVTTATTATSAAERLRQVHASLESTKKSPAPILSYLAARFASDHLPERLAGRLFRGANANAAVAVSNSRGYPRKVHINGRAVESSAGFLPLPPGIPVGVVVASYAGVVSLSVTAETWAVPDGDRFVGWMLDEYRRLCEECVEQVKVSGRE